MKHCIHRRRFMEVLALATALLVAGCASYEGRQTLGPTNSELVAQIANANSRLQNHEAKEEIRELLARYGMAADTGNADAYAMTWAEDGVYESNYPFQGVKVTRGRESFRRNIADPEAAHKKMVEARGSLHTVGPLIIRVEGGRAWAEGSSLVWIRKGEGYAIFTLAHNHWDLTRSSSGWVIRRE